MPEAPYLDEAKIERYIPLFWILIAIIALSGIVTAYITHDGHWIDKSGKVIVAASLLLTYLQFHYEGKIDERFNETSKVIEKILNDKGVSPDERLRVVSESTSAMKFRFEETRRKVLLRALATAGVGELVAAFGGTLFENIGVRSLLCHFWSGLF